MGTLSACPTYRHRCTIPHPVVPCLFRLLLLTIGLVSVFGVMCGLLSDRFISSVTEIIDDNRNMHRFEERQTQLKLPGQQPTQADVKPTVNFDTYMEQELKKRREKLLKACQKIKPKMSSDDKNQTELYRRVIVSDKYKLLFTYIPKVSCTLWKHLLKSKSRSNETLFRPLSNVDAKFIPWYLKHYRKAVFVRDPFTRLLSAWLSKLSGITRPDLQRTWEFSFKLQFLPLVRKIWVKERPDDREENHKWLNITFPELARFVVALGPRDIMDGFSDHWLPQSRVSHACHMQYDFIGHFENLHVEGPYLFKWLGAKSEIFPPKQPSAASAVFGKYIHQLTIRQVRDLFGLYRNDYAMFGYSMEETLRRITNSTDI